MFVNYAVAESFTPKAVLGALIRIAPTKDVDIN